MRLKRAYLFPAGVVAALAIQAILGLTATKGENGSLGAGLLRESQDQEQIPEPKSIIGVTGMMAFVITQVSPSSAAEEAGLQPGDLVTVLDRQINSNQDFQQKIATSEPGTSFRITYRRFNRSTGQLEERKGTIQSRAFRASVPTVSTLFFTSN